MRRFRHLTRTDRLKIEGMLRAGMSCCAIARELGVHRNTIYNERRKGEYIHRNSDWTEEPRYSADLADMRTRQAETAKGPQLKIGNDRKLADYIEHKIAVERYSPAAVLGEIQAKGLTFSVTIKSPNTIYSYIDKGIFLHLTNKDLPVRGNKKRTYNRIRTVKRAPRGESIERRPDEVRNRDSIGHWEMDTVVSGVHGKGGLLVLIERKTRYYIVVRLRAISQGEVLRALRQAIRKGRLVKALTITTDNGSEFLDHKAIEALFKRNCKTRVYYTHAYAAWEKGSVENANRIVRRWYPKGTDFSKVTLRRIEQLQDAINSIHRRLLEGKTANEAYLSAA